MRRRRQRPPRRVCRECGTTVYSWRDGPLCPGCARSIAELNETGWVRRAQVRAGNRTPTPEELEPDLLPGQLPLDDPPAAA